MPQYQSRAALLACAYFAAAVLIAGCGGGGGGGTSALSGKPAMRALTVSGYQTQVAGMKYELPLLVASAPSGSPLGSLGRAVWGLSAPKSAHTRSLNFDSDLNLYYETSTSGATYTVSYFTDAAGTTSAGFLKATIEGATSFNTNYSAYPVTVDMSANVTAGNLVANGTGKIVFNGGSGANTLTGTVDAPVKGIHAELNMTLDASFKVGGSITVVQNGLTAAVTGLTGDIPTGLTGSAAVTPGNLTGTATMNLMTGAYQLLIHDPSGLQANANVDTSRSLTINYNDNTSLTVSNAITAPVTGPATGGGGGGGSSDYTITPVNGNPWKIAAVSPDGKMVGAIGTFNTQNYQYWSSPTATPQPITLDPTVNNITATGVNSSGHIVGTGIDPVTSKPVVLYWSAYNQAPVHLATPTAPPFGYEPGIEASVFIQSSNRIVATFMTFQMNVFDSYVYSGPTDASPYLVQGGYITALSDGNAAIGIGSNQGDVVWPVMSPAATPIPVPEPSSTSLKAAHIGPDGTIIVDDLGTSIVWYVTGPSYTNRVSLQTPPGHTQVAAFGVGPSGQVLGTVSTSSTSLDNEGLIWNSPTAAPVVLRTTDNPNVLSALFETTSGALIVNCVDTPGVAKYHFSVMTPK